MRRCRSARSSSWSSASAARPRAGSRAARAIAAACPLIVGGERKPHDVTVIPFEDATAAAAIDVTAIEKAQGDLDRQIAAYDRTLDRVATAVAVFNRQQQLVFFNEAYAKLWKLDPEWLRTRPDATAPCSTACASSGALPEVVNYPEWKAEGALLLRRGRRARKTGGTCPTAACCTSWPRSGRRRRDLPLCRRDRAASRSRATTTR